MKLSTTLMSVAAVLSLSALPLLSVAQEKEQPKKEISFEKEIVPIIKANCISCHNKDKAEHNVKFEDKMTLEDAKKNPRLWRRSGREVKAGHMPPKGNGTMKDSERKTFVAWVAATFPAPQAPTTPPQTTGGGTGTTGGN